MGAEGKERSARVRIKRAYEPPAKDDGWRVLVDRLWPRGIARQALALDAWHKEVAPGDRLRRWFGHDPARWEAFVDRYRAELRSPAAAVHLDALAGRAAEGVVTLVYGARDEAHNNAVVLRDEIAARLRGRARRRGSRGAPG